MSFLPNDELIVFSTTRALRVFKAGKLEENVILQKTLSLGEFLERALLFGDLKKANESEQLLLMQEAVKSVKSAQDKLGIPPEFFAFLGSSEYIFSFFKELKREQASFDELRAGDTYAAFDEHLDILEELLRVYESLLAKHGLYDDISANYEINDSFIKEFGSISIYIDGIPSKKELEIYKNISKITELKLLFSLGSFSTKLQSLLSVFSNCELEAGFRYELDITNSKILDKSALKPSKAQVNMNSFSLKSLQASFIFDEISKMLRAGIKANEIAVILPDESFAQILRNLDGKNMLNFAMGASLKEDESFVRLDMLNKALKAGFKSLKENDSSHPELFATAFSKLNLSGESFKKAYEIFNQGSNFSSFKDYILASIENCSDEVKEHFEDELFVISRFAHKLLNAQMLELLLLRLKDKKLSLPGGGAVNVMGLLESRGLAFKGVIITDFNDNFVPNRNEKEMFLSSALRAKAGLISHKDREDLQKSYYENLFRECEYLSICYVKDDENVISRFARELGLVELENKVDEKAYENALLGIASSFESDEQRQEKVRQAKEEFEKKVLELGQNYDFFAEPLSFNRLKCFLDCERSYFYKYVLKLGIPTSFESDNTAVGKILHDVFDEYFSTHKDHCDDKVLSDMLRSHLLDLEPLNKLRLEVLIGKMPAFAKLQNEHFAQGFRVLCCEKNYDSAEFAGIRLKGRIDRIDERDGELFVVDYKSGKLPEDDLQLQFYKILCGAQDGAFLSFKANKLEFQKPKKKLDLEEKINEIKAIKNFVFKCEHKKHEYNDYKALLEGLV